MKLENPQSKHSKNDEMANYVGCLGVYRFARKVFTPAGFKKSIQANSSMVEQFILYPNLVGNEITHF